MRVPRHPTNIRRMLDSRVKQFTARKPLLAASLVSFERRCGKPGCHCAEGEKHHGHQLTYKVRGKTHTVYVPVDFTEEVRMMSQTQWKVALATPAEIEVNRPWLDQQAIGLGTTRPGPP
jgi:hypothetical protein